MANTKKMKIAGTNLDRRRKLTDAEREQIRSLKENERLTYRAIAERFNVSHTLVQMICDPQKMSKWRKKSAEMNRTGRYRKYGEERKKIMDEHLSYKSSLTLNEPNDVTEVKNENGT